MPPEDIPKRIRETETDIFPLDRMLPLTTVFRIFRGEYEKIDDKSLLLKERTYQRLREGYFALFIAVMLQKRSSRKIFMVFPKDQSRDVDFIEIDSSEDKGKKWLNDVKEYTQHETDFTSYTKRVLEKRIGQYSLIVGVHKDIESTELIFLSKLLKDSKQMAWIVSSVGPDNKDFNMGKIISLDEKGNYFMDEINLQKELPYKEEDPMTVYQDKLRDVYEE